jgi:hypothetical protein
MSPSRAECSKEIRTERKRLNGGSQQRSKKDETIKNTTDFEVGI